MRVGAIGGPGEVHEDAVRGQPREHDYGVGGAVHERGGAGPRAAAVVGVIGPDRGRQMRPTE